MSPDWRLMRRIVLAVREAIGIRDELLAGCLGAPSADVRQAVRVLYRQRKVDFCIGFVVAVPRHAEGRAA